MTHGNTFPPARTTLVMRLARGLLRLIGWTSVLEPLPGPKGILVVYPHTSNWDFIVGILFKLGAGLPASYIGKHTLFRWPLGWLFVRLGGIPVNRHAPGGVVRDVQAEFGRRDWMWLAIAPEGTRSRSEHWKSGFYRIALATGLPLGLAFIDYAKRQVGVSHYLTLGGDPELDMQRIREAYAGRQGRVAANASPIRLQGV